MSWFRRGSVPLWLRVRWKEKKGGGWRVDPVNQKMVLNVMWGFLIADILACLILIVVGIKQQPHPHHVLMLALLIMITCAYILMFAGMISSPTRKFATEFEALRYFLGWHTQAVESATAEDLQAQAVKVLRIQAAKVKAAQAADPVGDQQQTEKNTFRRMYDQFVFWGLVPEGTDWKGFFAD